MEKLLVLVTAFAALSAQAGLGDVFRPWPKPTAETSWSKLSRDQRVIFELPQFDMSYGFFLRTSSVCIDGDTLRSKDLLEKCFEYGGSNNDRCVDVREVYATKPMKGTETYCAEYTGGEDNRCVRWESYDYTIAESYEIPVYRRVRGAGNDDFNRSRRHAPHFSKTFVIPDCE